MNFLVAILLFLLFLPLNRDYSQIDSNALTLYSEGNYRHSLQSLTNKDNLNSLENYLLARDYQELKDNANALFYFNKVSPEELKKENQASFFLDNYCYFYSQALFDFLTNNRVNTSTDIIRITSDVMSNTPTDSIYYDYIQSVYLYSLWKTGDYISLTNSAYTNSTATFSLFSRYILGEETVFPSIIDSLNGRLSQLMYNEITNKLEKKNFQTLNTNQLAKILLFYLNENYELSSDIIKLHFSLSQDKDFYTRTRFFLEYRYGNKKTAISALQKFANEGKATKKTIDLLLSLLYRERNYSRAYQIIIRVMKKDTSYYEDYILVLSRLQKFDELYRWYLLNSPHKLFRRKYEEDILRVFLQNDKNLAIKLTDHSLKLEENYRLYYIRGLLLLNEGITESAYLDFLKVTLNCPFTYEWIVSKNYENEYRTNFISIYRDETDKKISSLAHLSLQDKLDFIMSLKEIDPELFQTNNFSNFTAGVEIVRSTVLSNLLDLPENYFGDIGQFTNDNSDFIYGFNREIFNRIEKNNINPFLKDKAAYYYRDLYKKLNMTGIIVSRLNHYTTSILGNRKYQLLLDENILKELYPLEEFDSVNNIISNTNSTIWILSAFREESHFLKDSLSQSGAVGVSQLMPHTAVLLKKILREEELNIYDSRDNLDIGSYHFKCLIKKYKNIYHSLAAYNAGEGIVSIWKKKYRYRNELWNECIDFDETRNYIKKIIQTRYFYNFIYGI